MNDDDREALQRQMTIRVVHLKLLQQRLDRLPDAPIGGDELTEAQVVLDRPVRCAKAGARDRQQADAEGPARSHDGARLEPRHSPKGGPPDGPDLLLLATARKKPRETAGLKFNLG